MKKLIFACIMLWSGLAMAWPTKEITIIVPFPPGGVCDTLSRTTAAELEKSLNTKVVVRNMPGGTMTVAVNHMLSNDNDNHTFLCATSDLMLGSITQKTGHHERFVPTNVVLTVTPFVFGGANASPEKFRQQIQAGGPINIGNVSQLGHWHLWTINLQGLNTNAVPYKGQVPLTTDVVGGSIEYGVGIIVNLMQFVQEGKVVPVMFGGNQRHPLFPNVPTFREMGLKGDAAQDWTGFATRGDTDPNALRRFSSAVRTISQTNTWVLTQKERGLDVPNLTFDDSVKHVTQDTQRLRRFKW